MELNKISMVKLQSCDLEKLRDLSIETFYESFLWGNTEANLREYLRNFFSLEKLGAELSDARSAFYFALCNDETVGYLKLNFNDAQTELKEKDGIEIERIYVKRAYQGKGIGQLIFDEALQNARARDARYVWLGVWEKNPGAIKFYERNGMKLFSSHSFKLGDEIQTDLMMRLEL